MELGEELKKIILAGIGAVAVTAEKAGELVDELVKRGQLTVRQGKVLNEELRRDVVRKVKDRLTEEPVSAPRTPPACEPEPRPLTEQTLRSALAGMNLARAGDLDALAARVAALEKRDERAGGN